MKNFHLVFVGIFGLVGAGLLTGAFFAVRSTLSFRASTQVTEGVVVDLDWSGGSASPVVEWKDPQGSLHRITGGVRSKPPSYSTGDRVGVRFDPARPGRAKIDGFMENWFVAMILGLLGSVFAAIGSGFAVHAWRKKKRIEWLTHFGKRIQAKFTGAHLDTSMRVNGRSPWRLFAQWQDPVTGEVHTFSSEAVWYDPTEFVKNETLDVLIDENQPCVHHVDIGFLPKAAN